MATPNYFTSWNMYIWCNKKNCSSFIKSVLKCPCWHPFPRSFQLLYGQRTIVLRQDGHDEQRMKWKKNQKLAEALKIPHSGLRTVLFIWQSCQGYREKHNRRLATGINHKVICFYTKNGLNKFFLSEICNAPEAPIHPVHTWVYK